MRAILSGEPGNGTRIDTSDGVLTITKERRHPAYTNVFTILTRHEVAKLRELLNSPEAMEIFP